MHLIFFLKIKHMNTFQEKIAVVTGAGSGIGRALAIELSKRGAHVAITDINEEGLSVTAEKCTSLGAQVFQKISNSSVLSEVQELVKDVLDEFGHVDIVINNAGIALGKKTLEETSYEELERIVNINLWGVIYGSKEFLPYLKVRPEAAIVNISSIFGLAGIPEQVPYCTTKFAVRGFTESLRGELAQTNVEVYTVHPGGINTNIAEDALKEASDNAEKRKEVENFKKFLAHSPEKAAKIILKGVSKKNYKILIGEEAYLFDIMTRALPQNYTKILEFGMNKMLK